MQQTSVAASQECLCSMQLGSSLVTYIVNAMFTCTLSMSSPCSIKFGSYPLLNIGCMMEPVTLEWSSPSACPNSCTATRNRFWPVNMQQAMCQVNYIISFFVIKPTRCTNFTNLFCHETLHVSDSSSVHHQQFIHCTLSNGINSRVLTWRWMQH